MFSHSSNSVEPASAPPPSTGANETQGSSAAGLPYQQIQQWTAGPSPFLLGGPGLQALQQQQHQMQQPVPQQQHQMQQPVPQQQHQMQQPVPQQQHQMQQPVPQQQNQMCQPVPLHQIQPSIMQQPQMCPPLLQQHQMLQPVPQQLHHLQQQQWAAASFPSQQVVGVQAPLYMPDTFSPFNGARLPLWNFHQGQVPSSAFNPIQSSDGNMANKAPPCYVYNITHVNNISKEPKDEPVKDEKPKKRATVNVDQSDSEDDYVCNNRASTSTSREHSKRFMATTSDDDLGDILPPKRHGSNATLPKSLPWKKQENYEDEDSDKADDPAPQAFPWENRLQSLPWHNTPTNQTPDDDDELSDCFEPRRRPQPSANRKTVKQAKKARKPPTMAKELPKRRPKARNFSDVEDKSGSVIIIDTDDDEEKTEHVHEPDTTMTHRNELTPDGHGDSPGNEDAVIIEATETEICAICLDTISKDRGLLDPCFCDKACLVCSLQWVVESLTCYHCRGFVRNIFSIP